MLEIRKAELTDKPILEKALANDEYHKTTNYEFYFKELEGQPDPRYNTNIYSIDGKPCVFVRGTTVLRLDLEFVDNDSETNREVMIEGFKILLENAIRAGYTEIYTTVSNSKLGNFMKKIFGFEEINKDGEVGFRLIF